MPGRLRLRHPWFSAVAAALVLGGCAGLRSSPSELATVQTSTATEYYVVRGATSPAIFEAIDRAGLTDASGRRAIGLTTARWEADIRTMQDGGLSCHTAFVRISLHLVMTLPRLEQAADLSPELRSRWERFAARVAAHEQRHVEIYLEGARRMKARMEKALAAPGSCPAVQAALHEVWTSQQAETEAAQERFHLEEDAGIERDRAPMQAQIDAGKARLAVLASQARDTELGLDDLGRQITAAASRAGGLRTEIARSVGAPAGCSQPGVPPAADALCRELDSVVTAHNALVDEHNRLVERQRVLAEEHGRTLAVTNDLIEALNWTR